MLIQQAGGGQADVNGLRAGRQRVLDHHVVQVVRGDDGQLDLDHVAHLGLVRLRALDAGRAVGVLVLAVDDDAPVDGLDLLHGQIDPQVGGVVEPTRSLAPADVQAIALLTQQLGHGHPQLDALVNVLGVHRARGPLVTVELDQVLVLPS